MEIILTKPEVERMVKDWVEDTLDVSKVNRVQVLNAQANGTQFDLLIEVTRDEE